MNCNKFKLMVDRYLDDDLTPEETNLCKAHLNDCSECSNYLALTKAMLASASTTPVPQSEPAWEKVHGRIRRPLSKRFRERLGTGFEHIADTVSLKAMVPVLSAVSAVIITASMFLLLNTFIGNEATTHTAYEQFVLKEIKAAEDIYEADLKGLKTAFNSTVDNLTPDIKQTLLEEENLTDEGIRKSHRLLERNPNNREARELLFANYRAKTKLYKKIYLISREEMTNEL